MRGVSGFALILANAAVGAQKGDGNWFAIRFLTPNPHSWVTSFHLPGFPKGESM